MTEISFTFGIVSDGTADSLPRLADCIKSIISLNIPNFEIIVVGPDNIKIDNIKKINFDDNIRKGWITKKKNLITKNASFDNIVYLHDYFIFDSNWYEGWKAFGDNFYTAMNIILNKDGTRYRDWNIFDDVYASAACKASDWKYRQNLIPYDINLSRYQYYSGAYWIGKKHIMEEFPLNENLLWGQGEDLEWSYRIRKKYKFTMNTNSTIHIHPSKNNHVIFDFMPRETAEKMLIFQKKEFPND